HLLLHEESRRRRPGRRRTEPTGQRRHRRHRVRRSLLTVATGLAARPFLLVVTLFAQEYVVKGIKVYTFHSMRCRFLSVLVLLVCLGFAMSVAPAPLGVEFDDSYV